MIYKNELLTDSHRTVEAQLIDCFGMGTILPVPIRSGSSGSRRGADRSTDHHQASILIPPEQVRAGARLAAAREVSMMIMRPPQHGTASAAAGPISSRIGPCRSPTRWAASRGACGPARCSRRLPLANNP